MTPETAFKAPSVHAQPQTPPRKGRAKHGTITRAVDRALWTATSIALGFGLAIIAIGIFVRDLWI